MSDINLPKNTTSWQTPSFPTNILWYNATVPPFDVRFKYREVVGKINLLEKITRMDITYAMHQCDRFYQYPWVSQSDAIIQLVKYMKATVTQGITSWPDWNKSFEVYANSNFCGNWHCYTAGDDPSMAKYRTGYSIMYTCCPIIWCRKLETQITFYTMEVEYIALYQLLRDVISMMQLLSKIKANGFHTLSTVSEFHHKAFE